MEPETDTPVTALYDLEQDVSPNFLHAVRKKIYRRTTVNQMVAFSWNLPKVILMELIEFIAYFFSGKKPLQERGKDNAAHDE